MKKFSTTFLFLFLSIISIAQQDSLEIKIGQMIMVGMPGKSVTQNSAIIKDIKKGIVGGVLLFENNVSNQNGLQKLTNDLQDVAKIPLLISIDQEGGKVNRLKTKYGFPAMPSAQIIGIKNNDSFTHQIGKTMATTIANCGINLNFAPSVDVYNPNCPVLGKLGRCYSSDVKIIANCAQIMIEEHKKLGVKTTLKHFPGHGNSSTDSHLGLTDVTNTWKVEELVPYKILIENGIVDMIMMSHIINTKLDKSGLPASLSYKMVTGLLRNQLSYNGVIITDDMQMHAIAKYYGLEQSLKKSINAGVDIVIFSNNIVGSQDYTTANIHATLKKLVQNGEIPMSRINESFARIMALKKSR